MSLKTMRSLLRFAAVAALFGCAAHHDAPIATVQSCAPERADFLAASDPASLPSVPSGGGETYYADLRRRVGAPVGGAAQGDVAASRLLNGDLTRAAASMDRVAGSFATLQTCRLSHAEGLRAPAGKTDAPAPAVSSDLLRAEQATFATELAQARQAAQQLDAYGAMLRRTDDRLEKPPGTEIAVARAAAAPPPPAPAFVATAATALYAKADPAAPQIARIRRGARVVQSHDPAPSGWTALELDDASIGYVPAETLRPAPLNPSAIQAAQRSEALRAAVMGDPMGAATFTVRKTLPDKQQALAGLIDSADEAARFAFNPHIEDVRGAS